MVCFVDGHFKPDMGLMDESEIDKDRLLMLQQFLQQLSASKRSQSRTQ